MAIHSLIGFQLQVEGDGVATTASIQLLSAPISYIPAGTLSPDFSLHGLTISGIEGLTCSDGTITVTGSIALSMLNLTFSPALQAGVQYTVSGTFLF